MDQQNMLNKRIQESNDFFKHLIDLIPSQVYLDSDSSQKVSIARKTAATSLSKQAEISEKAAAKRAKFDPDSASHTSDLQSLIPSLPALPSDDEDTNEENRAQNIASGKTGTNNDTEVKQKAFQQNSFRPKQKQKHFKDIVKTSVHNGHSEHVETATGSGGSTASIPLFPANVRPTPEQLREKLQARIAELRNKRNKDMTPEDILEKKKLRRKESKLKLKIKKKAAKRLKQTVMKQAKNQHSKMNGVSEIPADTENTNNSSNIVFSKFEFSNQAKKRKDKVKKPKSYKELYEKVTKEKQKLENLKDTDAGKAQKLEDKNAWKKAMDMSKGVKIKDNPELIKKSIKREEKLKQKSQKKWKERTDHLEDMKQKRQDKRKKNIQSRKQTKISKKIDKAKKKGRIISGF